MKKIHKKKSRLKGGTQQLVLVNNYCLIFL